MGLEEIVKEIIYRKSYNAKKGIEAVKQVYDDSDTEKDAIKKATDRVLREIEEHPDMPVVDFLKMIQEEQELPTDIVVETTKQIPDIKSEKIAAEAVEELDLNAPQITEIIQEADVSLKTAQKMISQIPDKKVKEEQQKELNRRQEQEALEQLQGIYDSCGDMNDIQLVEEISQVKISERTDKIEEKIRQIVAKKMAFDCMQFGGPKIPTMSQIVPLSDMLEADIPSLIEKEYKGLREDFDQKGTQYYKYGDQEKMLVKMKILDNIAKTVARNFEEVGDISVPQSEQMKNLSDNEIDIFIEQVRKFCKVEKLSDADLERIRKQVRGEASVELDDIVRMLQKMRPSDRERYIEMFKMEIEKGDKQTIQEKELDQGIYVLQKQIRKLPTKEAIKTSNMMAQMLKEREEAKELMRKTKNRGPIQTDGDTIEI